MQESDVNLDYVLLSNGQKLYQIPYLICDDPTIERLPYEIPISGMYQLGTNPFKHYTKGHKVFIETKLVKGCCGQ
jgi:hypothetical protein